MHGERKASLDDFGLDPRLASGLPGLLLLNALLNGLLALLHRVHIRIELDVVPDPVGGELGLQRRIFLHPRRRLSGLRLDLRRLRRWRRSILLHLGDLYAESKQSKLTGLVFSCIEAKFCSDV